MELRSRTTLEVKIGDRVYALDCHSDSPLGEIHDALVQMKGYVVQRINEQVGNEAKSGAPCQKEP